MHWSVFAVALPNRFQFQSLPSRFGTENTQNSQMANKSQFRNSLHEKYFDENSDIKENLKPLESICSEILRLLVGFRCNCLKIMKNDKKFKLSKIDLLSNLSLRELGKLSDLAHKLLDGSLDSPCFNKADFGPFSSFCFKK